MIVLDEYMKRARQMERIFPHPQSNLEFNFWFDFDRITFTEHDVVIEQDTGADVKVGVVELITQDYAVVAWEPERAHRTLYPKVYQPNKETFTVYR